MSSRFQVDPTNTRLSNATTASSNTTNSKKSKDPYAIINARLKQIHDKENIPPPDSPVLIRPFRGKSGVRKALGEVDLTCPISSYRDSSKSKIVKPSNCSKSNSHTDLLDQQSDNNTGYIILDSQLAPQMESIQDSPVVKRRSALNQRTSKNRMVLMR